MYMDTYRQFFRCYPVSQLLASEERKHAANYGGKIYMPPSALSKLTTMRISYPMLFEIRSGDIKSSHNDADAVRKVTHAGVLEFIAPEGRVYLPEWMMLSLRLKSGSLVHVSSALLELGTFVKLEPQSVNFLDISDPKAVLENSLRNFSALTTGDVFQISYNQDIYEIKVLEVKPETDKNSICVVETDLNVDFAPPVGYEETVKKRPKMGSSGNPLMDVSNGSVVGSGARQTEIAKVYQNLAASSDRKSGMKLNGKQEKVDVPPVDASIYKNRDAPALHLPQGQLFFGFPVIPVDEPQDQVSSSELFKGGGQALRIKK